MTQLHFMQNNNFGYEKENIMTFALTDELKSQTLINRLKNELNEIINIDDIAMSSWRPFDMSINKTSVYHNNQQEKDKLITVNTLNVNKSFIKTWGIKTLSGNENLILPSTEYRVPSTEYRQ
ncbi:hypothetical protein [Yersinia hibernica]|uniref:hypothetical protein n=1 Tax=Yersinia hibernica TaxID=2339259 RepID=UPI0026AF1283